MPGRHLQVDFMQKSIVYGFSGKVVFSSDIMKEGNQTGIYTARTNGIGYTEDTISSWVYFWIWSMFGSQTVRSTRKKENV